MGCNPIKSATDAIGLTDHKGAEEAREQSARAQQASLDMTEEQLAFQREQYDDWKAIYGDLQENLGNYYNSLDPKDYEARGLQAVQQEYQAAKTTLDRSLAQRGISSSGLQAAADTSFSQQLASARADVRLKAPDTVAREQMKFLGLGLGQGTEMLGINAGVANQGAANLIGYANSQTSAGTDMSQSNMNAMGTLWGGTARYMGFVPKV
jgi:hypothetical protein